MHALVLVLLSAVACVIVGRVLELVLAQLLGWWQYGEDHVRPGSRSGLSGDV